MDVQVSCWTCGRPILRRAHRVRPQSQHYCGWECLRKAAAICRFTSLWAHVHQEGECWIFTGVKALT